MQVKVEFYVPIIPAKPRDLLLHSIVHQFKGATVTRGIGYWPEAEDGQLCVETVDVITVFMQDTDEHRLWLEEVALRYKANADQAVVLYSIAGTPYFITD